MIGSSLVAVRGAELIDGVLVWPGSDRRRRDLTVVQRAWRFVGPSPMQLGPGERFLLATRLHWSVLVKDVTKMGAGPMVGYAGGQVFDLVAPTVWWVAPIVWFTVVVHTLMMCHHMLGWRAQLLVVTSRRVVFVRGVFTNQVQTTNLFLAANLDVEQSYWQRLLGYGTLLVMTGGEHDEPSERERFRHIPNPEAVIAAVYGTPSWV